MKPLVAIKIVIPYERVYLLAILSLIYVVLVRRPENRLTQNFKNYIMHESYNLAGGVRTVKRCGCCSRVTWE